MTLQVNTGWYFQGPPRWAGYGILVMALPVAVASPVWGVLLALLGIIIITTHYGVEIDANSKSYREYTWFLGLKNGKRETYDSIQYFFLKPGRVSRTYNSRIQSTTIRDIEYNGFLKFSESEKVHIVSDSEKQKALDKILNLALKLNTNVLDYSFDPPEYVAMKNA
jgi:hypothetical protein